MIMIIVIVGFVNISRCCLFRTEQSKPVHTFLRVFNPRRGKVDLSNIKRSLCRTSQRTRDIHSMKLIYLMIFRSVVGLYSEK